MKREFNIGSEWLYYKIYCGVKTTDIILKEYIFEKINLLKESKVIEKWFFIRYNDPDAHFRLRLLLNDCSDLNQVVKLFQDTFEPLQNQNYIWKIQMDTYVREIERYGALNYEFTESVFEADSELILNYLDVKIHFSNLTSNLLFSFLAIDNFLNLFKLSNIEKLSLLNSLQFSFKQEFKADKQLKKELDKHYRVFFDEFDLILERKNEEEYISFFDIIDSKSDKLKDVIPHIINNLKNDIFPYLSSQIHMMINRQYTSRQREYELIIYDHMYRYYKAKFYHNIQ